MVGAGRSRVGVVFSGGAANRLESWGVFSPSNWAQWVESFLSVVAVVWGHAAKVLRVGRKGDEFEAL